MDEIPLDSIPLSEDGIPTLILSAKAQPASPPPEGNDSWWDGVSNWAKTVTWQDVGHTALDIGGLFPGLGEAADAGNAAWYASEGNYLDAAFSVISMIPMVGDAIGKGGKYALKIGGKVASDVLQAINKHGGIKALLKSMDELGEAIGLPKNAIKKMKDALKAWYDKLVAKVKGEMASAEGGASPEGGVTVTREGKGGEKPGDIGAAESGASVPNKTEPNIVYRAITPDDASNINNGLGISAKARDGAWTAAEHVANSGPGTGGAAANSPWISTSRNLEVAKSYDSGNGVIAIDLSKVDALQIEVWQTAPRVNGVEGLPYHRSYWAEEVTIFQDIPHSAILGPVKQ